MTFYNEIDSYCAAWLRNLIANGQVSSGCVDERSIANLSGGDIQGNRAHFFAGIAGWEYALQLAGWPADRPVWTGSCPCQPLSSAGKRQGHADERHLWPAFYALIAECRPPTIFGEQVASKDGREWLAGVRADLEGLGYAVGAADLCAASVGAPHIRQRLFWVAHSQNTNWRRGESELEGGARLGRGRLGSNGTPSGVGPTPSEQRRQQEQSHGGDLAAGGGADSGLGDADLATSARLRRNGGQMVSRQEPERHHVAIPWSESELINCLDGKARRVEPRISPLADGVSARVGKLRAYGNAIIPQVAAEFIRAFLECES